MSVFIQLSIACNELFLNIFLSNCFGSGQNTVRPLRLFTCLLAYLLTYLHISTREFYSFHLLTEFSLFYGTQSFFYRVYNGTPPVRTLSQINPFHTPHRNSWRFLLISSSHISLGFTCGPFPSEFPTKICIHLFLPITCHLPRLTYYSRFDYQNNISWVLQIIKLLIM
jgi:hypothetical protein